MIEFKMLKLCEVGKIITGNTPSTKVKQYYENKDIPFYKPNDLNENNIVILEKSSMYVDNRSKHKLKILPKGSVFITCIGIIGKVGISNNVECAINQQITAIIPNNEICESKYLAYTILYFKKLFYKKANAPIVPIINKKNFSQIVIPIPPLIKQKEIINKLDKIQKLINKRKIQLEKLNIYIKSKFIEMFGDPIINSMGWEKIPLGLIFKVTSSKRIYQNEFSDEGVAFYNISDLIQRIEGKKVISKYYISEKLYNNYKLKNFVPKQGDILITSRGTLGKCYIIKQDDKFYFQDGMITWLINTGKLISNIFFIELFNTNGIQKLIYNNSLGATVDYISIQKLKKIEVLYPPIQLQEKFSDFVVRVNKIKNDMQSGLEKLQNLYKASMQEYFK